MGFRMERTIYHLVFDDPDFEGLEIQVHAASMEDRLRSFYDLGWRNEDTVDVRHVKQNELFELFLAHVINWNLEDHLGQAVEVTVKGFLAACEPQQVGAIIGAWQSGRQISAPLEPASPDIELSEIPVTVQPSTPEPG